MKRKKYLLIFLIVFLVYVFSTFCFTAFASQNAINIDDITSIFTSFDLSQTVSLEYVIPIIGAITLLFIIITIINSKSKKSVKISGDEFGNQVVDSISDAIIGIDKNACITFVNKSTLEMFNAKESEFLGEKFFKLICFMESGSKCLTSICQVKTILEKEYPNIVANFAGTSNFNSCVAYEVAKVNKHVFIRNLSLVFSGTSKRSLIVNFDITSIDATNLDKGMIITLRDVTEEMQNEKRLKYLATHDNLTELLNRDGLISGMKESDVTNNQYGLLNMSIDNLKEIKDVYGQKAADDCIKIYATIIKEYSPNNALVAKIGGDEFLVVMPYTIESQIQNAGRKFIRQAQLIRGGIYNISISVGISYTPSQAADIDDILMYSDVANTNASKAGKNQICVFSSKMIDDIMEEHKWESDIEKAFYDNEFMMYYQPIVDFKKERITKLEALARWNHPQKGVLSPWYFINRIERMSIVHEFCYWVIEEVFKDYNDFMQTRYCMQNQISISVNVSPQQLFDDEFTTVLGELMKKYNIPRSVIHIEVTESFFEGDFARSLKVVQEIKDLGCLISMDDFGTEYSTLSKLHTINFDEIKLDKSFVDNITSSPISLSITKMLVEISNNNGYELVAEGVETEEQLKLLTQYGCSLFQGYYFYKPISKNDILYIFSSNG